MGQTIRRRWPEHLLGCELLRHASAQHVAVLERLRAVRHHLGLKRRNVLIAKAAVEGAGAALIPRSIAVDSLASGRLVSWGLSTEPPAEVWVLHGSRRLVSPKIRVFVDFVCDYFSTEGAQDMLTRG